MTAPDVLLEQGRAKLREGLFEDAMEAFSACLALEPDNTGALQGRAMARFQVKDWAGAEADFTAAKNINPEDPENGSGLAMSLAMQNKIYPAIALFDAVIKHHPAFVQAHIQTGLLHLKIGANGKGRDHLKNALANRPTLAQRRLIESTLKEQDTLDKNRYYRPDFERLSRESRELPLFAWLRALIQRFRVKMP